MRLLFARFPQADAQTIKYALIRSGDPLPGSRRPGVRVNAARAIQLLTDGSVRPPWPRIPPPVTVTDPNSSLQSKDEVERRSPFRPSPGIPSCSGRRTRSASARSSGVCSATTYPL